MNQLPPAIRLEFNNFWWAAVLPGQFEVISAFQNRLLKFAEKTEKLALFVVLLFQVRFSLAHSLGDGFRLLIIFRTPCYRPILAFRTGKRSRKMTIWHRRSTLHGSEHVLSALLERLACRHTGSSAAGSLVCARLPGSHEGPRTVEAVITSLPLG